MNPKSLRRSYIYYMLSLVRQAVLSQVQGNFELDKDIQFHAGEVNQLITRKAQRVFDTAFVPYLLGVKNGIESERDIVHFIKQLTSLVPTGHILVNPARNKKEFHFIGQRYFVTTGHFSLLSIPRLKPFVIGEDKYWFKTQGLAILGGPH